MNKTIFLGVVVSIFICGPIEASMEEGPAGQKPTQLPMSVSERAKLFEQQGKQSDVPKPAKKPAVTKAEKPQAKEQFTPPTKATRPLPPPPKVMPKTYAELVNDPRVKELMKETDAANEDVVDEQMLLFKLADSRTKAEQFKTATEAFLESMKRLNMASMLAEGLQEKSDDILKIILANKGFSDEQRRAIQKYFFDMKRMHGVIVSMKDLE